MRILVVSLVSLSLLLTGCATGAPPIPADERSASASATPMDTSEIVTPVSAQLEALDGSTVSLNRGDFYDVLLPSGSIDGWTASVENPGVVQWMTVEPSAEGGGVSTLAAIGIGSSVVTITDGTTVVSFTVVVQ